MISEKTNNTYNTHIKKRLRFNELIEKWMASSSIRFKGATENKYWTIIDRHINPILGRLELSQITPSLINEFLNDKLNNGRIDGTEDYHLLTLTLFVSSFYLLFNMV